MPLLTFLLSVAWPIAKRVLIALGVGFVSYEGLTLLVGQIQAQVIAYWGQVGQVVFQVLSLSGFPQAMGIVLSAFAAKVSMTVAAKALKFL